MIDALLIGLGVWAIIGIVIGVPFVLRGVNRLDAAADAGSIGFRVLILPGVVMLWPIILMWWVRSSTSWGSSTSSRAGTTP